MGNDFLWQGPWAEGVRCMSEAERVPAAERVSGDSCRPSVVEPALKSQCTDNWGDVLVH